MRKYADRKRHDLHFQIGELVLVMLQLYRQSSVAERASNKLSARYFRLFKALKRIGQVVYQLELPSTTKIHDVLHVSLLKPYKGDVTVESMMFPQHIVNSHSILETQRIVQQWTILRNNTEIK